jgi:hypothetical protein
MIRIVEAVVDQQGNVRLLEAIDVPGPRRALVSVLGESPAAGICESALWSEAALADDRGRPEEDAAWSYLTSAK